MREYIMRSFTALTTSSLDFQNGKIEIASNTKPFILRMERAPSGKSLRENLRYVAEHVIDFDNNRQLDRAVECLRRKNRECKEIYGSVQRNQDAGHHDRGGEG